MSGLLGPDGKPAANGTAAWRSELKQLRADAETRMPESRGAVARRPDLDITVSASIPLGLAQLATSAPKMFRDGIDHLRAQVAQAVGMQFFQLVNNNPSLRLIPCLVELKSLNQIGLAALVWEFTPARPDTAAPGAEGAASESATE